MKRTSSSFLVVSTLALVLGATPSCKWEREPSIVVGVDGCAACGMVIDKQREAAVYEVDKEFHTFCSPGCLLKSYEQRRKQGVTPPDRIFFADYDTGELAAAETMTFLTSASK